VPIRRLRFERRRTQLPGLALLPFAFESSQVFTEQPASLHYLAVGIRRRR
jgi:hypothetical protein